MAVNSNWTCFIIFFAIYFQSDLGEGLELSGPNVCWKHVDGAKIPFCCIFFVQQDGKCRECEDGSFSNDSISCIPCPENMFGHKCMFKCSCLGHERCDPHFGCINASAIRNANAVVTILDVKINSETRPTIVEPSIPADFKIAYIYYLLAAGGVIGWIIFCLSCSKLIYKRRFQVRPNIQNCPSPLFRKDTLRSQCGTSLPLIPRKSQHIYDTVDEHLLSNIPPHPLPNVHSGLKSNDVPKQCAASFKITNNVSGTKHDEQEYLNPYNTLKDNNNRVTVLHEYVDCSKSCKLLEDNGLSQYDNEERQIQEQMTVLSIVDSELVDLNPDTATQENSKRVLNEYVDCSESLNPVGACECMTEKEKRKRDEGNLTCWKTDEQDYLIMH